MMSTLSQTPTRNTKLKWRRNTCLPPPDPNSPGKPVRRGERESVDDEERIKGRQKKSDSLVSPAAFDNTFAAICPHDVHQRFIVRSLLSPQRKASYNQESKNTGATRIPNKTDLTSGTKESSRESFLWPFDHHFVLIPLNSEYVITSQSRIKVLAHSSPGFSLDESESCASPDCSYNGESAVRSSTCTTKRVPLGIAITRISDVENDESEKQNTTFASTVTTNFHLPFPSISGWVRDYSSWSMRVCCRALVDALPSSDLLLRPPPPPSRQEKNTGKAVATDGSSFSLSMAAGMEGDLSRDSIDGEGDSMGVEPQKRCLDEEHILKAQSAFLSAQRKVPHRFLVTDAERTHSVWAIEVSLRYKQRENMNDEPKGHVIKVISGSDYFVEEGISHDTIPSTTTKETQENGRMIPLIGSGIRGSRDGYFTECRFHTPIALCWKSCESLQLSEKKNGVSSDQKQTNPPRPLFSFPFTGDNVGSLSAQESRVCVSSCAANGSSASYTQLFISDAGNHAIRLANFNSKMVRTIVGQYRIPGYRDGGVEHALISAATSMAYVSSGLLFTDGPNGALRLLTGAVANVVNVKETEDRISETRASRNNKPASKAHSASPSVDSLLTAIDSVTRSLNHSEDGRKCEESVQHSVVSMKKKMTSKNKQVQQAVHQLKTLLSLPSNVDDLREECLDSLSETAMDPPLQNYTVVAPSLLLHSNDKHMRVWTVAGGGDGNARFQNHKGDIGYKDNGTRSPHCAIFGYLTHLSVVPDISGGSDGAIYLCDASHHAIRVLTADGVHTLLCPQDFHYSDKNSRSAIAERSWTGLHVPLQVLPISLVRRKAIPPKHALPRDLMSNLQTPKPATVYSTYMALIVSNGMLSPVQPKSFNLVMGNRDGCPLDVGESDGGASLLLPVPQSFVERMESKANERWSLAELSRKMVQIGSDQATAAGSIPRIIGELSNLSIDLQEDTENVVAGTPSSFSTDNTTFYYLDHRRHLRYWFPWFFPPIPAVPAMEHTLHTLYVHVGGQDNPRSTSPPSFPTAQGVVRAPQNSSVSLICNSDSAEGLLSKQLPEEPVLELTEMDEKKKVAEECCKPPLCSAIEPDNNNCAAKNVTAPERFTPDPLSEPAPLPPMVLKMDATSRNTSTVRGKESTSTDRIEPSPIVVRKSSSIKRVSKRRTSVDEDSNEDEFERSATGLPPVRSTTASPPQYYTHDALRNPEEEEERQQEENQPLSELNQMEPDACGNDHDRFVISGIPVVKEGKENKHADFHEPPANASTSVVSFSSVETPSNNEDDPLMLYTKRNQKEVQKHQHPAEREKLISSGGVDDMNHIASGTNHDMGIRDSLQEKQEGSKTLNFPPCSSPSIDTPGQELKLEAADELLLPLPFAILNPPLLHKPSFSVCLPNCEASKSESASALTVTHSYPRHLSTFSISNYHCPFDCNLSSLSQKQTRACGLDAQTRPIEELMHIYHQFASPSSTVPLSSVVNNSEQGMSMISLWYFLYCTQYLEAPVALGRCFASVAEEASARFSDEVNSQAPRESKLTRQSIKSQNAEVGCYPMVSRSHRKGKEGALLLKSSDCPFLHTSSYYLQDPRIMIQHLYRSSIRQKGYHIYDALSFKAFTQLLFVLALWEEKALIRIGEKDGEGPKQLRRKQRMARKLKLKTRGPVNYLDLDEDEIEDETDSQMLKKKLGERISGVLKIENLFPENGRFEGNSTRRSESVPQLAEKPKSSASLLSLENKETIEKEDLFQLFSESALIIPQTNEFGEETCEEDNEQEAYEREVANRWRHYLSHYGVWTLFQEVLQDESSFLQRQKQLFDEPNSESEMCFDNMIVESLERLKKYRGISPSFDKDSWPFAFSRSMNDESKLKLNHSASILEEVTHTTASMEAKTELSQRIVRRQKEEEAVHCLFERLLANEKPLWAMFEAFGERQANGMPLIEMDSSSIRPPKGFPGDAVSSHTRCASPLLRSVDLNTDTSFMQKPPTPQRRRECSDNLEGSWNTECAAPSRSSFSMVMNWSQFFSLWQSVGVFPSLINHRELLGIFKESVKKPLLVPRRLNSLKKQRKEQQESNVEEEDLACPPPSTVLHFIPFLESMVRMSLQLFSTPGELETKKEVSELSVVNHGSGSISAASKLDLLLRLLQVLIQQNGDSQYLITQLRGAGKLRALPQQRLSPSTQFSAQPHTRSSNHEKLLKMIQNWGKGFDVHLHPGTS